MYIQQEHISGLEVKSPRSSHLYCLLLLWIELKMARNAHHVFKVKKVW